MQTTSCLTSFFPLYFEGRCTYSHFHARLQLELQREAPSCPHNATAELLLLLNVPTEAEAKSHIESSCQKGFDAQYELAWKDVTQKAAREQPLFDKQYYDGGSAWNEQYETLADNRVPYVDGRAANVLRDDGSRIDDVYEAYASQGKIECKCVFVMLENVYLFLHSHMNMHSY